LLLRRRACLAAACLIALSLPGLIDVHAQSLTLERITGEDGRYTIDMPRGYTSTSSPRPDGGTMRQLSYLWKDSVGQYNAVDFAIIDPPAGSTRHFDLWEAQRQITARYPGSFAAQAREIASGPAKGIEFEMTVNSNRGQGQHVIAVRLYGLEGRLYELLAATRVEDRNDPTVAAVMNSLRIIK
jgi:hypothetical protein